MPMKAATARKPLIRIAVVESDPLRFVGFRALFDAETDFELISASVSDITTQPNIDLILLGNRNGQNLFDLMASLKASRPDLRIIVTGSGMHGEWPGQNRIADRCCRGPYLHDLGPSVA